MVTIFLYSSTYKEARKENSRHLRTFINFFKIHNPLKDSVKELTNIGTGVIASDNINVYSAVDIGTKITLVLDNKKPGEISLKRKDEAKTLAAMRTPVKVAETVVQMSSDQQSQRLLASVVRDEAPLFEIFSHGLSGVGPSLFHDNGETRKNKQQN